jgi:two-component system sensor histidine kinase RegB
MSNPHALRPAVTPVDAAPAVTPVDAAPAGPATDDTRDRRHLRRLVVLRWIALATMAGAIATVQFAFEIDLPMTPLTVVVLAAVGLNGFTRWRISRPWPVRPREVLAQLLADTGFLAGVLYFTGGWSNPFVSLFLLPLVIAATVMPPRHAWTMAAVTFVCYTLLGFFHVPLPHAHHGNDDGFGLHVLGMWVSFVLSAGVIAWFVVRMSGSLRERDSELAAARERVLRDQHVLALGTLAAGAAHQLGTPLGTMAVLLRDLEHDFRNDPDLGAELRRVREQVDQCKSIISDLVAAAGQTRGEGGRTEDIDTFLAATVESWRRQRPGIPLTLHLDGSRPPPRILAERTLGHTLVTLLNNAADASGEGIEMQGSWTADQLTVEIRDRGAGLEPATLSRVGRLPITTKPDGHGVGLLIANAALERFGGRVTLTNRADRGACTRIELPLGALAA